MSKDEIFNEITKMISDQFDIDRSKIKGSLNFQNDLDADTIDFVEFILKLEDKFGAKISDETAEKLTTVDKAVNYIAEHSNKN